jgi:hypothetical protein
MSSENVTLQPLLTPDGKVYAYVVPAAELDRLRATENEAREREAIRWQQIRALLPKATPEQEAEMRHAMETAIPGGLDDFIAELEAKGYGR